MHCDIALNDHNSHDTIDESNGVVVLDAYFEDKDMREEVQATEIWNFGQLRSDYNIDSWNFGVVE